MNRLTRKVKGQILMVQITVVNQGDSLWSIANQYGVSVNDLAILNELDQETMLVQGQAIVIPNNNRTYYEYLQRLYSFRKTIESNAYIRATAPNAVSLVN